MMSQLIPNAARYEAATKTIRSVPGNHWLASMDSWDGAIDHDAMALVFAAAPTLLKELSDLVRRIERDNLHTTQGVDLSKARAACDAAIGRTQP